jgi:hypothetical protein
MTGGKAIRGIRMEHARSREPSVSESEHSCPREPALLASAAKGMPPIAGEPIPEDAQTGDVPRYRIIVEVSLHDRLEPFTGLAHRIVHGLVELLFKLPQLRSHAFADRLTPHRKSA